jgi:hypothetical protein
VWFDLRSVVQLVYTFVGGLSGVESSRMVTALRAAGKMRSLGGLSAGFPFVHNLEMRECPI